MAQNFQLKIRKNWSKYPLDEGNQTLHQLCVSPEDEAVSWGRVQYDRAHPTAAKYQNLGQPLYNFHHLWHQQQTEHGTVRIREICLIVCLSPYLSAANRYQVRIKVIPYKKITLENGKPNLKIMQKQWFSDPGIYIVCYTSICTLRTKNWKKNEISSLFFFPQNLKLKICYVEKNYIDCKFLVYDCPNSKLEQIISTEIQKDIE